MKEITAKEKLMPSTEEMFAWIEHLASFCHRRSGTPENLRSAEYIKYKFEEFGLQDVKIEHTDANFYYPELWDLTVDGEMIPSYFINYTMSDGTLGTLDSGNEAREMVYVGDGMEQDFEGVDVKGKIVLANHRWTDASRNFFEKNWAAGKCCWYDPDGTYTDPASAFQKETFEPVTFPFNYYHAMERGAAGFVGIMRDNCGNYIHYCENYTHIFDGDPKYGRFRNMQLPGLWVASGAGEKIIAKLKSAKSPVMARLKLRATLSAGKTNLVWGILPGMSDEVLVVHSHHDSVFQGAVQDASGMSAVLALAKYFGQQPKEARPRTLLFAAMDSHFSNNVGHVDFIRNRRKEHMDIVMDFSIEHIGMEARDDGRGRMALTGETGARLLFVQENRMMLELAKEVTEKYGVKRTLIVPVNRHAGFVCCDGGKFWENGYPVMSSMSPVCYLMDPMDTPAAVAKELLRPVALATAEMVERIAREPRENLGEEADIDVFA